MHKLIPASVIRAMFMDAPLSTTPAKQKRETFPGNAASANARKAFRRSVLRLFKLLGLFAICRRATSGCLRILCYHGAALADENSFRPGLFMSAAVFKARMKVLSESGYSVMELGEALRRRGQDALPPGATVITIDDGWYGTYRVMGPTLFRYGFPATLYVASYYLQKQTQVFNVAVEYVIWRSRHRHLSLSDVDPALDADYDLSLPDEREAAARSIIEFGEGAGDAEERQRILMVLCNALGSDGESMVQKRLISYMSRQEAAELARFGIDVQLHTHRHRFPEDFDLVRKEIEDNRSALREISDRQPVHFCYPSGEYSCEQIPWLRNLGIESATTTDLGINDRARSNYELLRILDSEEMSTVEFEAELCGFLHLMRRFKNSLASL